MIKNALTPKYLQDISGMELKKELSLAVDPNQAHKFRNQESTVLTCTQYYEIQKHQNVGKCIKKNIRKKLESFW